MVNDSQLPQLSRAIESYHCILCGFIKLATMFSKRLLSVTIHQVTKWGDHLSRAGTDTIDAYTWFLYTRHSNNYWPFTKPLMIQQNICSSLLLMDTVVMMMFVDGQWSSLNLLLNHLFLVSVVLPQEHWLLENIYWVMKKTAMPSTSTDYIKHALLILCVVRTPQTINMRWVRQRHQAWKQCQRTQSTSKFMRLTPSLSFPTSPYLCHQKLKTEIIGMVVSHPVEKLVGLMFISKI